MGYMQILYFIYFFIFLLLFICAYKAWFISPPCPHPLSVLYFNVRNLGVCRSEVCAWGVLESIPRGYKGTRVFFFAA
jgi:hypothetical protein